MDVSALPRLALVPAGSLRERLIDAVLRGVKTASSRPADLHEPWEPEPVGTRLALVDSHDRARAVVEIAEVRRLAFREADDEIARGEGDWLDKAAAWQTAHRAFWSSDRFIAEENGGHRLEITDDTQVVVRFFRVVEVV